MTTLFQPVTVFSVWKSNSVFILLFVLLAGSAVAADKKWEGDVSSDWNNPSNWQGNVYPGSDNDALIDPANYTHAPVISSNSTVTFKKLKVRNGAVLTIQANLSCADDVEVSGGSTINMSAGTLSFSAGNKDINILTGGSFNLTGGSVSTTGLLYISESSFTMSGSSTTLSVGSSLSLFSNTAHASFTMNNGTAAITTSIIMDGNNKPAFNQTISISGGTFTNNGQTYYNRAETDNSIFNVSGGTVTLTGVVQDNTTGKIQFNVSGGSLIFQNNLSMESGDALNQTGGTITFQGGSRTWTNAGTLSSTAGNIVFNDATATILTGAGTWNFGNIIINSGRTLTQNAASINVAGNWTNSGGTFNENTNTVVFNGTSDQTITGAETFYKMTTSKSGGTLILASNVTVSNTLAMTQGNITTGSNKITLGTGTGATGTLTYTAGTINGTFERWIAATGSAILFPVGTASYYRPLTTTFTNLTNGSLIVQFVASDPGSAGLPLSESGLNITHQFTEGYWNVTAANSLASTNYRIDITGTGFTSYGMTDNVRVLKRTDSGSAWTLQGTHVALSGSTASRTGLSGISTAQFGMGHVTCTGQSAMVTQPATTNVMQGSADNEIIRIEVNSSAAACTDYITQFNFSTAGTPGCTAPSTDISNAKVYYTGTSPAFATTTLFGSLGSAPNGSFSITGYQTISSNTVYFWLTYDIAGTAARNNVVDGKLVSFVMNGNTITSLTTPDPSGSRTIKAERYSVATGNWSASSTWSYISGGAAGASEPTSADNVYIENGYTVTVNSSGAAAAALSIASGGSASKLIVTTGGSLTCSSLSMTTTGKKAELYVQNTGSLTVNGNMTIDLTNLTEDANTAFQVNNTATATINGNLSLVNPSGKKLKMILNGSSTTTVTGNVTLSGNAANRVYLGMGGTARLNVKGSLGIAASKYGELYNTDNLETSVINLNGTAAQTLYLSASASNSAEWQYSTVWINNPAGVTLSGNVVVGGAFNNVKKAIYVKSGTLKTGGYSINLPNLATAVFQLDNGATFYTTTTDAYGGMPYFGTNQNNGKITLGASSTVTFAAAGNQTVPILSGVDGSSYGNIIIAGTGTKTLGRPHHADFSGTGALDIEGNLTTGSNVIFDVSASNYNITIAGNWTDQHSAAGTGFNERSGTVTFDGIASQTITPTASPMTFYRLTVNKSSGTLNISTGDVVISNTLTMTAGNINTGTRKLTLGTGTASVGTYSRTSGTIIGKFERWINATGSNREFPVGTSAYYRPATIYFSQLTPGSLIVEFVPSSASNTGLPLTENSVTIGPSNILTEGYWRCTAANSLNSTNYNITLTTAGFTSKIISSNTRVIKRANSSSAWTLDGTHVNATATTVGRNGLSGFSEFAAATVNCTPAVTASITVTSHACNNTGGALTLSTTNAQAPVSYTWSNGATTQNLSNLSSGNYTVTVVDYNNCTATATASVGVTAATLVVTHSTNYDSPNGAIDLTVDGGTGPYTFLWNDKGADVTTEDRTGLQNGWYVVTITDVSGCKYVKSAMVAYMDTIHAGSYIVNMGVMPQTINNALKPFGFINDMVRNQHVPVNWVINPDKTLYGTDFEADGIEFKGGPFIVEAEYIDNIIENRIRYWESKGVLGNYTESDMVVPVYAVITGFSNLGIDQQNEGLVIPYFNNAEVPTNIYYVGLPSTLGACDNAYVLPHADPSWANHHYLKDFVLNNGYVWAGCHAVSMLEGIYQPGNPSNRMNFLSKTGLQCYSAGKCGSVGEVHAGTPTQPYTIDVSLAAHPLMQFMGDLTPSTENGSEKWYIPVTTGGWNTGVYRAITTSDGSYGREGVKLVFGNAFDDKDNGLVMYEAGHTAHNRGTTASMVAAQRTFFNFILHSGIDRRLIASMSAPAAMSEGTGAAVSVTVTSGGAPFTYQWSTNVNGSFTNPTAASTTFNLTKGNGRPYARITVAVTDACGRIYYESKTIRVLYAAGPVVSYYNGYNISCNGGSDGTIRVEGLGGTPPYTYEWGHGATTAYVSGLSAGTYTVTITDAMSLAFYDTIELTEPPAAVWDTAVSTGTILCYGDSTGSIDLTITGGLPPYNIQWSNGETAEDISNLPTGTYDVTVTDINGCYAVASPPVAIGPDSLTITGSITNVSCYGGSDGTINLTVTGGTGPYTYSWSTGATASSIAGITTGEYFVTVTDANGCTKADSFDVAQPAEALGATSTTFNIQCFGESTGAILLWPAGGTSPYTYSWTGGATTQDIANVPAGTYTVTITDASGCTLAHSKTLTQPAAALSASSTTVNPTCNGTNNGSIDLTPAGGTSPYTYSWTGGATTQDISGKAAGTYTVTITDASGCTLAHSKSLTQPGNLTASIIENNITTCYGDSSGSAILEYSGGTGPFTIIINEVIEIPTGMGPDTMTGLMAGTISVQIKDANNCLSPFYDIDITEPSRITSTLTVTDVSTPGGSDGAINQSVSGGNSPYMYSWSNGAGTRDISSLTAGTYAVTITDDHGCTVSNSAVVDEPPACPCTWLGTISNVWSVGGNWDCGYIPTDTCDAIIPAATPFTCNIQSNAACRSLTIKANATLIITGSNQLEIHGNLTNNGTFICGNSVVKFLGTSEQHIYGSSQTNFWNVHIINSSATGVQMHKSIGVFGDLRLLDGYLFTNTDTVKVETSSQGALQVFSPNSFIVGKLRRKINNIGSHGYEFPVGNAGRPSGFYRAYIRTNNLQGTSYLTVWFGPLANHNDSQLLEAFLNPPSDIANHYPDTVPKVNIVNGDTSTSLLTAVSGYASHYVNNHYNLQETIEDDGIQYTYLAPEGVWHFEPNRQPTGGFYDMIIYITNLSGLSDNNFGILKRPTGTDGRYWCSGKGMMNPFNGEGRKLSDGFAKRMMLTTFSEGGGGGGGGGGLPIELLDFSAKLVDDYVELTWVTATEINNEYFTVEKSDGKNFRQVAIIPGAGNSTVTKYYSKIDYDPFPGVSYYRLKQTDYDGRFAYSQIVSVNYQPLASISDENEVIVFPNPSGGNFSVVVKKPAEKVTLNLYDVKGKLIYTTSFSVREENQSYQIQLDSWEQGVYYLKADLGNRVIYTKKLMLFGEK